MDPSYVPEVHQETAESCEEIGQKNEYQDGEKIHRQTWSKKSVRAWVCVSFFDACILATYVGYVCNLLVQHVCFVWHPRCGAKSLKQSQVYPKNYGKQVAFNHCESRSNRMLCKMVKFNKQDIYDIWDTSRHAIDAVCERCSMSLASKHHHWLNASPMQLIKTSSHKWSLVRIMYWEIGKCMR